MTDHETQLSVDHLSLNHVKTMSIESDQTSLKSEITQLNFLNEELKKTMEEQTAIFVSNVDDVKRQLSGSVFIWFLTLRLLLAAQPKPAWLQFVQTEVDSLLILISTSADLVDKMHTVENEVYRMSQGVASPAHASASPSGSTKVISSSSNRTGISAHQTAECQVAEESARRLSKLDPVSSVSVRNFREG